MYKTNVFAAGIALTIAGCHSPGKTDAWRTVTGIRKQAGDSEDRSSAYAAEVHAALDAARIEHKVVTFEYTWTSRFTGNHTKQRTAVLYRDPGTPKHPWWIADEPLRKPLWLPSASVERQVAFYVRRPVTVIEVRDFGPDFKAVRPLEKTARKPAISRIQPAAQPARPPAPNAPASAPAKKKTAPQTRIEKAAQPAHKAEAGEVPTAKPVLINQPEPSPEAKPEKTAPPQLDEPKPLPPSPSEGARLNIFQRILGALIRPAQPRA